MIFNRRDAENHDIYPLIRFLIRFVLRSVALTILLNNNGPLFVRLIYPPQYTWANHIARIGVPTLIRDVLWTFSKFLEAFAIVPQIHLVRRQASCRSFTLGYISLLAVYRFLYGVKTISMLFHRSDPVSAITGLMQMMAYANGLWTCSRIKPGAPPSGDVVENILNDEKAAQIEALDEKVLI